MLVPAALAVLAGFGAFAAAVWAMTARQRPAPAAVAARPTSTRARSRARVRRRSPAALAGYELPLGLLGFPGVGWLFAGFPFTASILLMAGPRLRGRSSRSPSALRGGSAARVGWMVELVWLPTSALVSAALLYRAQRRRRIRLDGPPPRRRLAAARAATGRASASRSARSRSCSSRSRSSLRSPASAAAPFRYSYQTRLTPESRASSSRRHAAPVKLFAWREPQEPFPADALRLHAADVRSLLVRAAAVDRPGAYQLFDLDRGTPRPARVQAARRELELAPARRLAPGRYLFVATHEGMFGGRDFAYLRVVPLERRDGDRLRPDMRPRPRSPTRSSRRASLLAALFACSSCDPSCGAGGAEGVLGGWLRTLRGRGGCEALAQRAGWSPGALPRLLPRRRSAHRRIPRRRLGLAAPATAGA